VIVVLVIAVLVIEVEAVRREALESAGGHRAGKSEPAVAVLATALLKEDNARQNLTLC
jgi:hypothetical protein